VVSFRAAISSLREQASSSSAPAMVHCDFQLCRAQGLTHPPVPPRVRGWQGEGIASHLVCIHMFLSKLAQ
jgi:hypothetical protein